MLARDRYRLIRNLPTPNSAAVTAAPIQTCDQSMRTSGRTLNTIATSTVMTANETIPLRTDHTWLLDTSPDEDSEACSAASAALISSDTNRRNPRRTTRPSDSTRV